MPRLDRMLPHPAPPQREDGRAAARPAPRPLAHHPAHQRRLPLPDPRILDQTVRIQDYPQPIRQIAIRDLGHDKPTLLLTNQLQAPPRELIDRYARRMLIENTIADAVNFFHMDALPVAVPLRIDLDVQLILVASALCRLLAARLGEHFRTAEPASLFRKLVDASATVDIRLSP